MKQRPDPTKTKRWPGVHKARVLWLGGQRARIDRDIAPLIEGLHALGIETFSSCQGSCMGHCGRLHPCRRVAHVLPDGTRSFMTERIYPKRCRETVALAFCTASEATKFLNVVYRHSDPEALRDAVRGEGSGCWVWKATADGNEGCDLGADWITRRGSWVPKPKRPFKLSLGVLCLFPRKHLEMVSSRTRKKAGLQ